MLTMNISIYILIIIVNEYPEKYLTVNDMSDITTQHFITIFFTLFNLLINIEN